MLDVERHEAQRGAELAGLFFAAEVPPIRADVGLAIATAERQARRRRVAVSAVAVLAVAAVAAATLLAATGRLRANPSISGNREPTRTAGCVPQLLPMPAQAITLSGTGGFAADPSGRYQVGSVATRFEVQPVLWVDGQPKVLQVPDGVPLDVSAAGVVVGVTNGDGAVTAWTYRDGKMTTLPNPNRYTIISLAVNARGDVAGSVSGAASGGGYRPVIWRASNPGRMEQLPVPTQAGSSGGAAVATDIGDDGTVVGSVGADGAEPVRWRPDGTAQFLPKPPDTGAAYLTVVRGRYGYGFATRGVAAIPERATNKVLVRWDLATGQVNTLPGTSSVADSTPDTFLAESLMGVPLLAPDGYDWVSPVTITTDGAVVGIASQDKGSPEKSVRRWVRWGCGVGG